MLGKTFFFMIMLISVLEVAYATNSIETKITPEMNKIKSIDNTVTESLVTTTADLTHLPREGIPLNVPLISYPSVSNVPKHMTENPKETTKFIVAEKNDGKPIVAKKGAKYEVNETEISSSTPVDIYHSNKNKSELNSTKVFKSTNENKLIGDNFMLPLLGFILAIPLVGILSIVCYKHGAEWWQHRHYRRMDFLIDGIYNN